MLWAYVLIDIVLIVWKGAQTLPKLSTGDILACIFGVAGVIMLLSIVFLLPYLYRLLIKEDWELKWYHYAYGPLLLRRGEVPPKPEGHNIIRNYYEGFEHGDDTIAAPSTNGGDDIEKGAGATEASSDASGPATPKKEAKKERAPNPDLPWYSIENLWYYLRLVVMHGVDKEVVTHQSESVLMGNLKSIHDAAPQYDNKAEHTYSFLQVLTASTASFAHGANDISK